MNLVALALAASPVLAAEASAQGDQQQVVGSALQDEDTFGIAVAVSGDWSVVGATGADDLGVNSGAAYIYERTASGWVERQRIKASDAATNAAFGSSVDIEGTTIVVGAPGASFQGMAGVGAIYTFECSGGVWSETSKLVPNDAAADYALGFSVALSGSCVIGGAIYESHAGLHSGAAYLFENTGGSWTQAAKVVSSDGATSHLFGYSVSLNGSIAAVGAVGVSQGGYGYVGAAYVFEKQGTQWPETQKLMPPNPSSTQYFAIASAINTDSILVGAPGNHMGAPYGGAVFVYQHPNMSWDQTAILVAPDVESLDDFGRKLSVSGDHAIIGSLNNDSAPAEGAAYIYRQQGQDWQNVGKCVASGLVYGDVMDAASIDGSTILVSNPFFDGACPGTATCDSGAAYFFEFAHGTQQYGSCAAGGVCANTDSFGGCPNSTGQGAVLGAWGTTSVSADDLVLQARWLPHGVSALCFMGRGQTNLFLGDGRRVVAPGSGSGLFRFPVQSASPDGVLQRGPGLVATSNAFAPGGHIQPGQTWNFQVWYRDTAGPCSSGTNTTNGLSVVFEP